jgi:cold shock protein
MSGSIKAIVEHKGFGFITVPGERDVFFHVGQLENLRFDSQLIGQRVTFEIEETGRGPKAKHVRPARD